jgi:hypothetical protein
MSVEVKTHRELHGKDPAVGYEWDAGNTPPEDPAPGRWTVRRDPDHWVALFHSFIDAPQRGFEKKGFARGTGPDYIIATFLPTEQGERAAKTMALKLVDMAWGRT